MTELEDIILKQDAEIERLQEASRESRQMQESEIERLSNVLAKWQQIAINERARVLYFAHAGDDVYDMACLEESDHHKERHLREAAEELNLQATQPDDDNLTIAYMLGGKKADERLEVLQGYVARLEKAYLADSMQSEELARAALNKIREGK